MMIRHVAQKDCLSEPGKPVLATILFRIRISMRMLTMTFIVRSRADSFGITTSSRGAL